MPDANSRIPNERISAAQASLSVVRNTLWNLLGTGLPIALALITIPVLIHSIGTDRFGILVIAWVVLSYFGLFDLGLGRATIKFLAEAFERRRFAEVRGLFWTSLILTGFLGLIGAAVFAGLTPLLVNRVLNIPPQIQPEALSAFFLIALSVPFVTVTAALRGTLEAQHRFDLLNAIQAPASALTQVAPLLALPFSNDLFWLVGAMVISRGLGAVAFLAAALWQLESPFTEPFFLRKRLRALFSFGGWLVVSNVISPLMVHTDKFFIGSLSSMTAVTYYATPYEAVTRLWILPTSLMRTIFPIFSAEEDVGRRTHVYWNAMKYLALVLAPVIGTLIVFAPELLRFWVGASFAENSTFILQVLALGMFVNSLGMLPFGLIQGLGRPDVTAKFHLLELPFYFLLLWYSVRHWGGAGAAVVWTIRVIVDSLLLILYVQITNRLNRSSAGIHLRETVVAALSLVLGSWVLYALGLGFTLKLISWILLLGGVSYYVWRCLLASMEREKIVAVGRRAIARITSRQSTVDDRGSDR